MSDDKTRGMTEAELAEYYNETRDFSDFDESAAEPVEVRRNVTISVRFSQEEIEALRREAEAAGVKVTAYIRAAALQASSPVDRKSLQEALRAVSEDVARVERLLVGKETA
jgi:predicted DNA binding CopG/RHH family protein